MSTTESPEIAYWREGLQTALEEVGCFDALTSEQYDAAAPVIARWADDKAYAFGEHCIPDPVNTEHQRQIKLMQERLDDAERSLERMGENFVATVARMHGVNPDRLYASADGHVKERR